MKFRAASVDVSVPAGHVWLGVPYVFIVKFMLYDMYQNDFCPCEVPVAAPPGVVSLVIFGLELCVGLCRVALPPAVASMSVRALPSAQRTTLPLLSGLH